MRQQHFQSTVAHTHTASALVLRARSILLDVCVYCLFRKHLPAPSTYVHFNARTCAFEKINAFSSVLVARLVTRAIELFIGVAPSAPLATKVASTHFCTSDGEFTTATIHKRTILHARSLAQRGAATPRAAAVLTKPMCYARTSTNTHTSAPLCANRERGNYRPRVCARKKKRKSINRAENVIRNHCQFSCAISGK